MIKSRTALVAMGLVLPLLLAGCGAKTSSGSHTKSAAPPATSKPPQLMGAATYQKELDIIGPYLQSRTSPPLWLPSKADTGISGAASASPVNTRFVLGKKSYSVSFAHGPKLPVNSPKATFGNAELIMTVLGRKEGEVDVSKWIPIPQTSPIRNAGQGEIALAHGIVATHFTGLVNGKTEDAVRWQEDGWTFWVAPMTSEWGNATNIAAKLASRYYGLHLPGQHGVAVFAAGQDAPSEAVFSIGSNSYAVEALGWRAAQLAAAMKPFTKRATSSAASGGMQHAAGSSVALVKEPIGQDYLELPKTLVGNTKPNVVQVGGTPYGVVVAVPPGFPGLPAAANAPPSCFTIWLGHPDGAHQSILTGANYLGALDPAAKDVAIAGVTGHYAVFTTKRETSRTLWSVPLRPGAHPTAIGADDTSSRIFVRRGVAAWLGKNRTLHVVQFATGKYSTVQVPGTKPVDWHNGSLAAGQTAIKVPFLTAYQHTLPQGFRWISVARSNAPIVAVPTGFKVQEMQGGSSQGVRASSSDGSTIVTAWTNACAGCYNPAVVSTNIHALSTPMYDSASVAGTKSVALSDHALATTRDQGSVATYGLTIDYPFGGDIEIDVTLPKSKKSLATEILNSVWWP